jgi:hypothetical protein
VSLEFEADPLKLGQPLITATAITKLSTFLQKLMQNSKMGQLLQQKLRKIQTHDTQTFLKTTSYQLNQNSRNEI